MARNGSPLGEGMTNERPSVSENPKFNSTPIPNQCLEVDGSTAFERERSAVSDRDVIHSDLVEIAKRNRKNYGVLVGAILYLHSINAARPRLFWSQALVAALAAACGFWWR